MPAPNYDLIAIDLDGTLLDRDGSIPDANRDAVDRARAAGLEVVVCTGRGHAECVRYLRALELTGPAVVAGGAIIAEGTTGRSVHRFNMPAETVAQLVAFLNDKGHAALVLKDASRAGYDYLVLTGEEDLPLDPVSKWWFEELGVNIRLARVPADDPHPDLTVRVGACAAEVDCDELARLIHERFGDEVVLHSFQAVVAPDHATSHPQGGKYNIFEAFSAGADKWGALSWLLAQRSIEPGRVAAIGDEINDLPMIRGAGLGVAMGNARQEVRDIADRHTRANHAFGVAHAIDQILEGAW